jgi:hypothetical protein
MSNACLALAAGAFLGGWLLGRWAEAQQWRAKATSGFRMASGGRLFTVREETRE